MGDKLHNIMNRQMSFTRKNSNNGTKQWIHSAESLTKFSVIYSVKFLGNVEVDHPKGSEVVKDAIRKMKFNKQLKRAEGQKCARVEISISIRSISIIDPKIKAVLFQYPLHLVSYCADDKGDKRMFSFIAKDKTTDKHRCFVFDSERSAMDITMTLGQAFELAYQHFLDSSSKSGDLKNQLVSCHKKIRELTEENYTLKQKVTLLENLLENKEKPLVINPPSHTNGLTNGQSNHVAHTVQRSAAPNEEIRTNGNHNGVTPILSPPPPIPSRSNSHSSAHTNGSPSHPPQQNGVLDLFGATPFTPTSPTFLPSNPFSPPPPLSPPSGLSSPVSQAYPYYAPVTPSLDGAIDPFGPLESFCTSSYNERDILDMQVNLSRGLSFGTDDFSLDDFDPLKK